MIFKVLCVPLSVSTYFQVLNSLLTVFCSGLSWFSRILLYLFLSDWSCSWKDSCGTDALLPPSSDSPFLDECLVCLRSDFIESNSCSELDFLLIPLFAQLLQLFRYIYSCSCQDSSRCQTEYDKTYVVLTNDSNRSANRNNNRCQELSQTLSHTQYYGH